VSLEGRRMQVEVDFGEKGGGWVMLLFIFGSL
jgi:hypothetical protein